MEIKYDKSGEVHPAQIYFSWQLSDINYLALSAERLRLLNRASRAGQSPAIKFRDLKIIKYQMDKKVKGHTLSFVKVHAKRIKKNTGVKHTEALEQSAKELGFKSYKDCLDHFK